MRRCRGALYGPLTFMGKKKHAIISPYNAFQDPRAPMTDQERKWLKDVITEKKVVRSPIEKPIEIPKEYLSYWESSAERDTKRLNRQHKFLATRLEGLAEAISGYSKRNQNPPKGLWNAHRSYLEAVAGIEAQLGALKYALSDSDITRVIQEAANNA